MRRVKTSFHTPIFTKTSQRLQGTELPFRNVLLPWQNAFEKFTIKLNFVMTKAISKVIY